MARRRQSQNSSAGPARKTWQEPPPALGARSLCISLHLLARTNRAEPEGRAAARPMRPPEGDAGPLNPPASTRGSENPEEPTSARPTRASEGEGLTSGSANGQRLSPRRSVTASWTVKRSPGGKWTSRESRTNAGSTDACACGERGRQCCGNRGCREPGTSVGSNDACSASDGADRPTAQGSLV